MDLIRSAFGGATECTHKPDELASPNADACEECGSTFNLRMCASCGHVGCCESQMRDAETHWRQSGHEVMVAMPVGRSFSWCYEHKAYID